VTRVCKQIAVPVDKVVERVEVRKVSPGKTSSAQPRKSEDPLQWQSCTLDALKHFTKQAHRLNARQTCNATSKTRPCPLGYTAQTIFVQTELLDPSSLAVRIQHCRKL
jgi:hypothetical protein